MEARGLNTWLQGVTFYSYLVFLLTFSCFSVWPLRLPLAHTQETRLPHYQHLTPYGFFCPQCLSQTKLKINNAFSPPFPL